MSSVLDCVILCMCVLEVWWYLNKSYTKATWGCRLPLWRMALMPLDHCQLWGHSLPLVDLGAFLLLCSEGPPKKHLIRDLMMMINVQRQNWNDDDDDDNDASCYCILCIILFGTLNFIKQLTSCLIMLYRNLKACTAQIGCHLGCTSRCLMTLSKYQHRKVSEVRQRLVWLKNDTAVHIHFVPAFSYALRWVENYDISVI